MNNVEHHHAGLPGRDYPASLPGFAARLLPCLEDTTERAFEFVVDIDISHEEWRARFDSLTSREKDVLHWIVEDKTSKQIADLLGISRKTVDFHRAHLMKKLGARSVVSLIKMASAGSACTDDNEAGRQAWAARLGRLTSRERKVLHWIIKEKLSKQIADLLGISRKTVDFHRAHMMEKLHARSLVHLVKMAVKRCAV